MKKSFNVRACHRMWVRATCVRAYYREPSDSPQHSNDFDKHYQPYRHCSCRCPLGKPRKGPAHQRSCVDQSRPFHTRRTDVCARKDSQGSLERWACARADDCSLAAIHACLCTLAPRGTPRNRWRPAIGVRGNQRTRRGKAKGCKRRRDPKEHGKTFRRVVPPSGHFWHFSPIPIEK